MSEVSKVSRAEGWAKLIAAIFAIIGSAWVGIMTAWSTVGNLTTDQELQVHNETPTAHTPLQQQFVQCQGKVEVLSQRVEKDHQDSVALGARLVRLIAADRESNRNFKAAAASYFEEEYKRLVRKGVGVEEAMLEALRSPWYDRPKNK